MITVRIRRLPHGEGLALPGYATAQSAGMDLLAAVTEPVTIEPGGRVLIPTGLCVALPPDHELQVRPRSGVALKHGVTVLNAPGTIDADYRGEIGIILHNASGAPFVVQRGDRIAQAVLDPVLSAAWMLSDALDDTTRGDGGFGSTGIGRTG